MGEERRVRRNASWVPSMVRRRGPVAGGGGGGGMAPGMSLCRQLGGCVA